MDEEKKNEMKSFFSSRRFGVSLLFCLIAVIIGVAAAVGAGRSITDKIELASSENPTTSVSSPSTTEAQTKEAAADVTGVPDERTTTEKAPVPTEKKEGFILPLGNDILKDYSDGNAVKSKTMDDWRVHNGIDFKGKEGDKVKAIQSGAVLAIYSNSLWGTVVEIDHGNGLIAKYCGLKEGTTPYIGDVLEQGETVGTLSVIPSESADEPHLHFEILISGKNTDPLSAMGMSEE